MRLAVDARRNMLEHCEEEIDLADRERKHALFSAESARDKKTEKVKTVHSAAEEHARLMEERQEARETAARELSEAREERERLNRELAERLAEEEKRRASHKVSTSLGSNAVNSKKAREEESMNTVMRLTGTSHPDKLLELWENRDERNEATRKNKEYLESVISKKRKQAEDYAKDLQNVKLGGVASSVGLREADMLDNKVYGETARVEKFRGGIGDVVQLYARMSDGFQFLLVKVKKSIAMHSDSSRPGPGMTLPQMSSITEGDDDDNDAAAAAAVGDKDAGGDVAATTPRMSATGIIAAAAKIDETLSIGSAVIDLVDKFDDLLKTVLEPLGGAAAAEAHELPGDTKLDGDGSGDGGGGVGGGVGGGGGGGGGMGVLLFTRVKHVHFKPPSHSSVSSLSPPISH